MSDSDGLCPAVELEHVDPVVDECVESGAGVNKGFRAFDPDAVMLVPPSLNDWLPQDHLPRFIADVVEAQLDLSRFYASYTKIQGPPPYDPRLMIRVLFYGYCVCVRSSRELERVCVDVVAFRWLAAQQAPDFRSLGRFRKHHLAALRNVFLEALELCRPAGMVSLGQVAWDGTKVCANAARRNAMSYARLSEKQKVLADEVSALLAEADATEGTEDARFGKEKGDDDDDVAKKGDEAAGNAVVAPKAQRNFTEPESRIMKTADGSFHYA
jgi:transposase